MKMTIAVICVRSNAKPKAGGINIHHARTAERMVASVPNQKPPSNVATTIAG